MSLHPQEGVVSISNDRPLTPSERVLLSDREYHDKIVHSTVEDHGAAVEAVIRVAMQKYQARHRALVNFMRPTKTKPEGGHPAHKLQSGTWREAEANWNGAHEALAALLGQLYPDLANGRPRKALVEALALVEHRVGPLCTGFRQNLGSPLQHHPEDVCPVHGATQQ